MKSLERSQQQLFTALGVGILATQLESRIVAPVISQMGHDLDISVGQSGWILSAFLIPYGVFQLVFGPLAGRFGKMPIVLGSMFLFAIASALCGAWMSFPAILVFRFIAGAAAAAIFPLSLAYVGDTVNYERRQSVIGFLMTCAGVAGVLSATLGGFIASAFSWRGIFPLMGMLAFIATAYLAFATRHEVKVAKIPLSTSLISYGLALREKAVRRLLPVVFLEGFLCLGVFPLWGQSLARDHNRSPIQIGLILGVSAISQILASHKITFFKAKMSETKMVGAGALAMTLAFSLVAFAPHWAWYVPAALLVGIGYTFVHSTFQAVASEMYPKNRATGFGLFAFSAFSGSGLGAVAAAYGIGKFGFSCAMGVNAAGLMACSVISMYIISVRSRSHLS